MFEQEFNLLLSELNKKVKQAEFDLMNGDFLIQTHCTEIRRQVQLAKETSIQKIEEQTEQLIDRINTFECESLDTLLKTDKDQFISKLNEIKNENEKWNKHLNEYKIDLELFDDLRNSLSKFAIERENINYLLFKSKLLEFKPIENIDIGRLSTVVIDSFEHKICFTKHIEELMKDYFHNKDYSFEPCANSFAFLSNGDFIFSGEIVNRVDRFVCTVIVVVDFKINYLKSFKEDYKNKIKKFVYCSNKICILFKRVDEQNRHLNDLRYYVLDENLRSMHEIKCDEKSELVAANESYLFFTKDPNPKEEYKNSLFFLYDWSLQFVRAIGQSIYIERPSLLNMNYINHFDNRIYCADIIDNMFHLKVFDDFTGNLIRTLNLNESEIDNLSFDSNYNMILFKKLVAFDKAEIKIFNFSGDLFLKSKFMESAVFSLYFIQNKKLNIIFSKTCDYYLKYQKHLDESNSQYTVKSQF